MAGRQNTYGTSVVALRHPAGGTARNCQSDGCPYLRPGGTLLLSTHGWLKVERGWAVDGNRGVRYDPADASAGLLATPCTIAWLQRNPPIPIKRLQDWAWRKRAEPLAMKARRILSLGDSSVGHP